MKLRTLLTALAIAALAWPLAAQETFLLSGECQRVKIDSERLPSYASKLFTSAITGQQFRLHVQRLPPGDYQVELYALALSATNAGQEVFSIAANGVFLDPKFDAFQLAGGALIPVIKSFPYHHPGGTLILSFEGRETPAMMNALGLKDRADKLVAQAVAANLYISRIHALDAVQRPFRRVKAGEIPLYNTDHSPVGAWASFVYGASRSGGMQVGYTGTDDDIVNHSGVILGVRQDGNLRLMPFYHFTGDLPEHTQLIAESQIKRSLSAATDHWDAGGGLAWTHYSPSRALRDWAKAAEPERRAFCLPATWMVFSLDNQAGKTPLEFLFSLQQPAQRAQAWEPYAGYIVGQINALATRKGAAELLTPEEVKRRFGLTGATSAFAVQVAPGRKLELPFFIAHYVGETPADFQGRPMGFFYTRYWTNAAAVLAEADGLFKSVPEACARLDQRLDAAKISPERKWMAAQALHSYRFNTVLFEHPLTHEPLWELVEGECKMNNTLDLTVDVVFYELAMHPWTTRNVLDTYRDDYSYTDEVYSPSAPDKRYPGGYGFYHDLGFGVTFFDPKTGAPVHHAVMTHEELENWILCAALYWKVSGDNSWLEANRTPLQRALASLLVRDDVQPSKRDGIPSFVSTFRGVLDESTTYDAMDPSLRQVNDSLYITMKAFACYTVLEPLFSCLKDSQRAGESHAAAVRLARNVVKRWNASEKCFPAIFDGKKKSHVIPAIEGLIYPYAMGLNDVVSNQGPYAELIRRLRQHLDSILKPGVCLDPESGGWRLTDTAPTTWQSKVYLNQFISEEILGIRDQRTGGAVDQTHLAYEVLGAPAVCWTCQINNGYYDAFGCRHYPRGVTSALWWLFSADNKPAPAEKAAAKN